MGSHTTRAQGALPHCPLCSAQDCRLLRAAAHSETSGLETGWLLPGMAPPRLMVAKHGFL